MDKYISVITNFGCHYTCPYCIVRNNNLHIPKSTVEGLNSLEEEIRKNNCNWVSLSGGGDPLWNLEDNIEWYKKFLDITFKKYKIELHTSMLNVKDAPYAYFDRIVYHLHDLEQLKFIKRSMNEVIRVVFVVTENFTEDLINRIAVYCHNSDEIDEFRQMVDNNYQETDYCKDYLKAGHQKLWWYIEQNDYNLYYCENKVYTEYRRIGE
nr:MAG TPA: Molybdenum cofactor biosynthesis protein A barrel, LIGAND BINDING PROTEIN [Caudoviricetes sp.]